MQERDNMKDKDIHESIIIYDKMCGGITDHESLENFTNLSLRYSLDVLEKAEERYHTNNALHKVAKVFPMLTDISTKAIVCEDGNLKILILANGSHRFVRMQFIQKSDGLAHVMTTRYPVESDMTILAVTFDTILNFYGLKMMDESRDPISIKHMLDKVVIRKTTMDDWGLFKKATGVSAFDANLLDIVYRQASIDNESPEVVASKQDWAKRMSENVMYQIRDMLSSPIVSALNYYADTPTHPKFTRFSLNYNNELIIKMTSDEGEQPWTVIIQEYTNNIEPVYGTAVSKELSIYSVPKDAPPYTELHEMLIETFRLLADSFPDSMDDHPTIMFSRDRMVDNKAIIKKEGDV